MLTATEITRKRLQPVPVRSQGPGLPAEQTGRGSEASPSLWPATAASLRRAVSAGYYFRMKDNPNCRLDIQMDPGGNEQDCKARGLRMDVFFGELRELSRSSRDIVATRTPLRASACWHLRPMKAPPAAARSISGNPPSAIFPSILIFLIISISIDSSSLQLAQMPGKHFADPCVQCQDAEAFATVRTRRLCRSVQSSHCCV